MTPVVGTTRRRPGQYDRSIMRLSRRILTVQTLAMTFLDETTDPGKAARLQGMLTHLKAAQQAARER